MKSILARLREPTTIAGIAGLLTAVAAYMQKQIGLEALISAGIGVAVLILMPEKK